MSDYTNATFDAQNITPKMTLYLTDGPSASTLQYAWKPLISYNTCNTQTGNAGEIDRTMMCAGDTGVDACQVRSYIKSLNKAQ